MSYSTIIALAPTEELCESVRAALQANGVAGKVVTLTYPSGYDTLRELALLGLGAAVVMVQGEDTPTGIQAIARVRECAPGTKIVALGETMEGRIIVEAMRAGAADYLEFPPNAADIARALIQKEIDNGERGRIFSFVNAKGGCGATTLAVNTALSLLSFSERVALVDLAVPGNAALHLNIRPKFTVRDIYRNLHRMDSVLLEQFMTAHESGIQLAAGADEPDEPIPSEQLAALFDLIAKQYEYVVVDASTHLNEMTKKVCEFSEAVLLVAQTDIASIWNAQRLRSYLGGTDSNDKVKLVLNRYKKSSSLDERELEQASGCKIGWRFPNQFARVSHAITTGNPASRTDSDLSSAFVSFLEALTGRAPSKTRKEERRGASIFKPRLPSLKALSPLGLKASDSA